MKTNFFATIFYMLIFSTSVLAQFGIQAGGAASKMKMKSEGFSYEPDSRTGFSGGITYRMPIGNAFSFQPELNWLQKGLKDKEDGAETNVTLNYMEIPLYFLFTGSNPSGFYGGIGPSFNLGMSGKSKYKEDGQEDEEDVNFGSDESDDLKGFHMAINAQAGYKFGNGLVLNAFVAQSITNSAIKYDDVEESDGKISMVTYGLRIGYFIPAKKAANIRRLKQPF